MRREDYEGDGAVPETTVWEMLKNCINYLQEITNNFWYRVVVGVMFLVVFGTLSALASARLDELSQNRCDMDTLENVLRDVQMYQAGKYFVNDKQIWNCVNMSVTDRRYENLTVVLNRVENLTVRWQELDSFTNYIDYMSISVTCFPFFFNLPWCANIFSIIAVMVTKVVMYEQKPVMMSTLSYYINFILGSFLLATHFARLCSTKIVRKRRTIIVNKKENIIVNKKEKVD